MADPICPMIREPCIQHRCAWFTQVLGKHPQKDAPVAEWACAIGWIPLLQIETTQMINQLIAATNDQRNEARKDADAMTGAMATLANSTGEQARRLLQAIADGALLPAPRAGRFLEGKTDNEADH